MRQCLTLILTVAAAWAQPRARDLYFAPVKVAAQTAPTPVPLGLRYSLLKLDPSNNWREVSPSSTFVSGDRIRLQVEANQNGFLYVLHQGSSKEWFLMEGSPITVERARRYDVPPGGRFYFDHQAGEEKLFFVLTRTRDAALDEFIGKPAGTPPTAPPPATAKPPAPAPQMVNNTRPPIQMAVMRELHTEVRSRNLTFEKVDSSATPAASENAVYAVNMSADPQSRIVVDLTLQHR